MESRKNLKSEIPNDYLNSMNSNGYKMTPIPSSLSEESQEGGLEIGRIFEIIRRRFTTVLGVTTVILSLSIIWNRTRPPVYEGNFRILIEPITAESEVVSAVTGKQSNGINQDNVGSPSTSKEILDYPTQIQLLLSPKLLLPVVKQLKSSYPDLSYDLLKDSLVISRLVAPQETKILDIRYKSKSLNKSKQIINLVSQAYINYSLKARQTNVLRAIQFLDVQRPKVENQVIYLQSALQKFQEENQVIDPSTLATQISNQIGNAQQQKLETQVELTKAKQLYSSLEQQLQLETKGAEAGSVLSEAPEYQLLVKQLQELDVEIETKSSELDDNHPTMISLREKRAKLLPLLQQKANAVLGSGLSRSIPNGQSLPYQNALRQDLSKQFIATSIQVPVLESKLNGLNIALQDLASKSSRMPSLSRQYENMQRQLLSSKAQLSRFLQTREDLIVNASRREVPWELIAPPSVNRVSSSGLLPAITLGLILGLLLGTGVALLIEQSYDVIHSLKDLEREINIPILGVIPEKEDERRSPSDKQNNIINVTKYKETDYSNLKEISNDRKESYRFSSFTESFLALNSQIRLLRPDLPIQSLVVSSSLREEGKTTVALHLAQAAAAMGQKVLLIDADFRKTTLQDQISDHIENSSDHGLADVIIGRSELMHTVQSMIGYENLYILPAGSNVEHPSSLLSSIRMQNLMKECRHNYDLVIYDTVSLDFADTLLLIPQTDGLLIITRLGKIHRKILQRSLKTLRLSKVSVLGLVANMY